MKEKLEKFQKPTSSSVVLRGPLLPDAPNAFDLLTQFNTSTTQKDESMPSMREQLRNQSFILKTS
jgi:hypothetical protein